MKLSLILLFITTSIAVLSAKKFEIQQTAAADTRIVCYFLSWAVYRSDQGKFDVDNIDPFLCTHLIFSFLGLQADGSINILDPGESNPDGRDGFGRFVRLKQINPDLKTIISMGGWEEGSERYSQVAADPAKRAVLVNSVLNFLDQQGFDGFDFDWESPCTRNDNSCDSDKQNYVTLLTELKAALSAKGYSLSVAVTGGKSDIALEFNVAEVSNAVDFINVMTYDYHGSFNDYVGHHTLLYSAEVDVQHGNAEWNVDSGISYWIEQGADPAKLNLGIATYGRTFTLTDPDNAELYAPATPGSAGPYTNSEGALLYNEICKFHGSEPDIYNEEQKVYHKVSDPNSNYPLQWIGYDNIDSIATKVQYALSKNLGGIMVWSIDSDDFSGECGEGTYPLINSIKNATAKFKKQTRN